MVSELAGYSDSYLDLYGRQAPLVTANESGRFYRNGTRFILAWGHGRGMGTGFRSSESWEVASSTFRFNGTPVGRNDASIVTRPAWNTHGGGALATLKTAIDTALIATGYDVNTGVGVT